jgi:hypothetical protein
LLPGSPYIRAIGPVQAVAGHDITLHCPYSGYPISTISWERRGQEVPADLRRTLGEGGSLTISRVDPTVDAGSYVCSVRGNKGELARREVQLTVNSEYVKMATGLNENGAVQSATSVCKIQSQ